MFIIASTSVHRIVVGTRFIASCRSMHIPGRQDAMINLQKRMRQNGVGTRFIASGCPCRFPPRAKVDAMKRVSTTTRFPPRAKVDAMNRVPTTTRFPPCAKVDAMKRIPTPIRFPPRAKVDAMNRVPTHCTENTVYSCIARFLCPRRRSCIRCSRRQAQARVFLLRCTG